MIKKSLFKVVMAALLFCTPSSGFIFGREDGAGFFDNSLNPVLIQAGHAGVLAGYVVAKGLQSNDLTDQLSGGLAAGLAGVLTGVLVESRKEPVMRPVFTAWIAGLGVGALSNYIRMRYLKYSLIKENQKKLEELTGEFSNPPSYIRRYKDFEDLKQWLESPSANLGENFLINGEHHFRDLLNKTDEALRELASRNWEGTDCAVRQRLEEVLQKHRDNLFVILGLILNGDPQLYEQQQKQMQEFEDYMRPIIVGKRGRLLT